MENGESLLINQPGAQTSVAFVVVVVLPDLKLKIHEWLPHLSQ